jgi:hypothetical protein
MRQIGSAALGAERKSVMTLQMTADEHRYRLDPRRCRRRLQPDRATQGEDGHPRSSVSDTRPSMQHFHWKSSRTPVSLLWL